MQCNKCKGLLVKTTLGQLKKEMNLSYQISSVKCSLCKYFDKDNDFQYVYHCYKCKKDVCKLCAYKNNIINLKKLSIPNGPIFLEKTVEQKIKENNEVCEISKQKGFKIIKRGDGKNITIYLKKLVGTIYTININDSEKISKLKGELRKIDDICKENNTILVWKNKILDDDEYIYNYNIENESIVDIILKRK